MAEDKQKFLVSVTPLVKIPLSREQFFYYLSDDPIPPGSLVSVPLARKNIEGIVLESKADFSRAGGMTLKKVTSVLAEDFLTAQQLELARFISDYYVVSLGIVLKGFIPKRTKARDKGQTMSDRQSEKNSLEKISLTDEQKKAVRKIAENYSKFKIKNSKFLLHGPAGSGKTEVYIHSILELRKLDPDSQFLILVPEKTLTPQALERYGAYFPQEEIALLSSNLSAGKYFSHWQRIRSGEAKIIIGTRMAVFAPFRKLALIVIDEEQDISFKQWDMNPRYDARTAAEKLATMHRACLVRGSATPSVEGYFRAQQKEYALLELTMPYSPAADKRPENFGTVELVDMKKERWNKNRSCLSKKLQSEISYALKNNLQTILFINRQGMSNFSICRHCRTVLKCPRCDRALVYTEKREHRCAHCAFVAPPIPQCAKCHGIEFENVGLGTQKVEREVRDLFPQARIARLDSGRDQKKDFQAEIYERFSRGEIDILVGTQMLSKGWDLPKLSLVAVIDADNPFSLPDFRAGERAWQNLVQLSGRVSRPGAKFPGRVIIQTYHPENKLLALAAEKDYARFYEQELPDRKALRYPPFGRIAKLVFEDYSRPKVVQETERAYNLLAGNSGDVNVSAPDDSFVPKIRGRYRRQIILKFSDHLPKEILTTIKSLPSGWIIDIDPISSI